MIRPFRGLRYSPEKAGDLSAVAAPPYDVISPAEADALRARHPNNVIRLILGETPHGRTRPKTEYQEAARLLREWTQSGILRHDEEPSFYICEQEFLSDRKAYRRRGFIARVLLEDMDKGAIYGHEETIPGPKADRLELMRACRANLSQVFSLYPGGKEDVEPILKEASDRPPDADAADKDGTVSRLWRTSDKGIVRRLTSAMAKKPLFIADGHHRYETALLYQDTDGGGAQGGKAPSDYVMMYCVAMDDPGLVIWPTHRVIRGVDAAELADFAERLNKDFEVRDHTGTMDDLVREMASLAHRHAFGLIQKNGPPQALILRSENALADAMPGRSPAWRRLDVSILHALILDRLLGMNSQSVREGSRVGYVKSPHEADARVQSGDDGLAFLLNPTRVDQVREIAAGREKMPAKSTYFFPKLLSGMVINCFGE